MNNGGNYVFLWVIAIVQMLHEFLGQYNIPVCYDFPTSHDEDWNTPLVEGCPMELTVTPAKAVLRFQK